jgi:hypothetical protein
VKAITVRLPGTLAAWLSRRAAHLGCPQDELVREALEQTRRGNHGRTCHDLVADTCGSINGPKNLSTNRKHFCGIGSENAPHSRF